MTSPRRPARIFLCVMGLSLVLAGSLSACASSSESGGVLRLPIWQWDGPDPAMASNASTLWTDSLLYSGLVKLDQSLHVVPDLAVQLPSVSSNGRTYFFTIRADAHFADGHPVQASDFAYSFRRALSPPLNSAPARADLGDILGARSYQAGRSSTLSGVRVSGKHRLRLVLRAADPDFLTRLTAPPAAVIDPRVCCNAHWFLHGPGTGPFQLLNMGNPAVLRPNPHYYAGSIRIDRLDLVPVSGPSEAYHLYQLHKLDAAPTPPNVYSRASHSSEFVASDTLTVYYLGAYDLRADQRHALDQSLDRYSLAGPESYLDPQFGIIPSTVPDYITYADPRQYDPTHARELLRHGITVALGTPQGSVERRLDSWLTFSWRRVGIEALVGTKPSDVRILRVAPLLPVSSAYLQSLKTARLRPAQSHRFDFLLRRAQKAAADPDALSRMARENLAERYLLEQSLIIPLAVVRQGYLLSPRLHGLTVGPDGLVPQSETWATVVLG